MSSEPTPDRCDSSRIVQDPIVRIAVDDSRGSTVARHFFNDSCIRVSIKRLVVTAGHHRRGACMAANAVR